MEKKKKKKEMCLFINKNPEVKQAAQWVGLVTPWSLLYNNISIPLPSLSVSSKPDQRMILAAIGATSFFLYRLENK